MNKANIIPLDDQTTPGEHHPEDETTGGAGRMRTVVTPNPKCMGCLHYDNTRSHCMVALAPASCGDGSKPEAGYAPMVPNEEAYQEWRAKRGLAHNAPRGSVDVGPDGSGAKGPVGGPQGAPDFVVQVLGDEGHVELSQKPGNLKKGGTGKCAKCGSVVKGASCRKCQYKSLRTPLAFDSKKQADRVGGPVSKAGGKISWGAIKRQAKQSQGFGMPGHKYSGSAMEKVFGEAKPPPTKYAKMSKKQAKGRIARKPGQKVSVVKLKVHKADPWAIAGAAWKKVSSEKKAQYVKRAMARHRKAGEAVHASKYANRAPREFMERLARKGGGSLIEEFGQGLGGFLYKARHDIRKAGLAAMPKLKAPGMKQGYAGEDHDKTAHLNIKPIDTHNPKRGAGPQATEQAKNTWSPGQHIMGAKVNAQTSPVLQAVRSRQMKNPSPESQNKARQAGGGKVFSHASLAKHAGVKPENIADLAHASQHVHDFHNKVRSEFGDKVKHLTSAQIRSAYHSTGLMHSLTIDDLDLIKAHKAGKRHVIGHTSTGKPIHSDGHMAEGLKGEEHSEAGELHEAISQRLSDAAFGHTFGGGRGKLPAAAHKYLMGLSDHHRELARRHRASHPEGSMLAPIAPAEPFGKSGVKLGNNPTDAEIAKAMMSGGGAGALIASGSVNAPMNLGVDTSSATYGLPAVAEKVELQEEPKKETPRRAPIVGGVLSAAWDLGQPLDE